MHEIERQTWHLPARIDTVARMRREVVDFIRACGVSRDLYGDVRLAVSELVTNAVRHAYPQADDPGPIIVDVHVNGRIEIAVRDRGVGLPDDLQIKIVHGLGIVEALGDALELRSEPGTGTEATVVFELPSD